MNDPFEHYRDPEPLDNTEELRHYGVKGMKWGVRKSKKKTGVSRLGGAVLDRNTRTRKVLNDARDGGRGRRLKSLGEKFIGADGWERNYQQSLKDLKAQDDRIRAGKMTILDKIEAYSSISLFDLVVSVSAEDKKNRS